MLQPLLCSAGCLISAAETRLVARLLGHIASCTSLELCVQKGRLLDGEVAAGLSQGAQGTFGCMADVRTCVEALSWRVSCMAPWQALGRVGSGAAPCPGKGGCSPPVSSMVAASSEERVMLAHVHVCPCLGCFLWARLSGAAKVSWAGSSD